MLDEDINSRYNRRWNLQVVGQKFPLRERRLNEIYKPIEHKVFNWAKRDVDFLVSHQNFDITGLVNGSTVGGILEYISTNRVPLVILHFFPLAYFAYNYFAFDFGFPSRAEHTTWWWSCRYILIYPFGPFLVAWVCCRTMSEEASNYKFKAFIVVSLTLYAGARLFLVVESFLSLRGSPIGVYWAPSWLQMIPHV